MCRQQAVAGSVGWSSSSSEVGSEGATTAEDSVDSVCGIEGASEVKGKSAKKQTTEADRSKKKEGSPKGEMREVDKEVVA